MRNPSGPAEFIIPRPGGRVARVPLDVLEQYVAANARSAHIDEASSDAVEAHSMSIDAATGTSAWHLEWELGHCVYTDEAGFPQTSYVWHRHPLGTEYAEIYQK